MPEKVYLKCRAKARDGKYGRFIALGVKADDLIAFVNEHTNDRGYINLTISERKEVGQYGDTHSVALDTYEPPQRREQSGWD